ncbi:hypothetical protein GCM10009661_75200 [Catellatospora chokoriensis]|uniref:Uncharacterized protein n=1 Tax=Catellatospora chokoriensis TaxID=310353 RepID=A0A8J3KCL7_9ACTN|nr:hypothetical protein Cch02nite_81840 [Catellatospora chokoriensis]
MRSPVSTREAVHALVAEISPVDAVEAEHRDTVLAWISSDAPLYRVSKPDNPPMHLVSYMVPDADRRSRPAHAPLPHQDRRTAAATHPLTAPKERPSAAAAPLSEASEHPTAQCLRVPAANNCHPIGRHAFHRNSQGRSAI